MDRDRSPVLEAFMSELSEEFYAAGWLNGLEYDLWARVEQIKRTGKASPWGGAGWETITEAVTALYEAAKTLDQWCMWSEDAHGPVAVPLSEWESVHWPEAPEVYRDLADRDPECGDLGPMVRYRNPIAEGRRMPFSYFSHCDQSAGHKGEHTYRDRDGNLVDHDPVEPVLVHPDTIVTEETVRDIVGDDGLASIALIESALSDEDAADVDAPAYIWVDPARLTGEACVGGTRLAARQVADMYRWYGMRATTQEFGITRPQVLVACWFVGIYGNTTPLSPQIAAGLESAAGYTDDEAREWTAWWGDWAKASTPALWERHYDRVENPPRLPEWDSKEE